MSVYPVPYGMSKYDLFWRYLKKGNVVRVGAVVFGSTATLYTCPEDKRCYIILMVVTWTSPNASGGGHVYILKPDNTKIYIAYIFSQSNSYGTHNTGSLVISDVITLDGGESIVVESDQTSLRMGCFAEVVEL